MPVRPLGRVTMTLPNRPVRPFVVDPPILHPFVRELRESDRLQAFAKAFPAAARVSEPALPLLLAALHEELARPLVLLAPEDQDARDAAEGAAWFLGDERVGMFPSRGVHWGSGLDPAPHLVGERGLDQVEPSFCSGIDHGDLDRVKRALRER